MENEKDKTIYLKDAVFVDWQTLEFKNSDIDVPKAGKPIFIDSIPKDSQNCIVIDCKGKLVTKSFGCGHHHIYSALARGMAGPPKAPSNFVEILEYVWWKLDKSLDLEMIEASALVTGLYCAKNGVTFIIDHHSSPYAAEGSLETIAEALDKIGLSHLLCYENTDRNGKALCEKGLSDTENYLKARNQGLVGLHASFTVGKGLLEKSVSMAEKYNSGIHVHVAEDAADQKHCIKNYGKRVIQRFKDAGVLDMPKTIIAHGVHLDQEERKLVKNSPVFTAQSIESNLNNRVGIGDYREMGANIMLGTDGMHSDMLRSLKASYFNGQSSEGISMDQAYARLRNVNNYIRKNGFYGDDDSSLVILDYDSPTPINKDNFLGHLIFGIDSFHVHSVINRGKLIVKDSKVLTIDEDTVLSMSRQAATRLWKS